MSFYDAIPDDWLEPGATATVSVDGFPIAIANVDGGYYAFQNLCPHQGTTLGAEHTIETIECLQARGRVIVSRDHTRFNGGSF